ncbi:tetratricopeptide repeat protein [Novosphingobium bradum]|uniref:Tetratricopeptide repeat protein n=1 Tax=Novosphingobium bradum TaxID=1737444 RepID=A0ABV7IS50_9SPHN
MPIAKHRALSVALACTALLGLGGCKIFGVHRSLSPQAVALETRSEVWFAGQLQAGKAALADGRFAEAVVAFSNLRGEPGYDAEACNGLAIAYAGIGRTDLAANYFRRAILASPDDARFRRNLAMLEDRLAPAKEPARAALADATKGAPIASGAAPEAAVRVAARPRIALARVSDQEVMLQAAPGVAQWEPVRMPRPAVLAKVSGSHGRTIVMRPAAPAAYPVRIVFGRDTIGRVLR